jgi:hypothetical protein
MLLGNMHKAKKPSVSWKHAVLDPLHQIRPKWLQFTGPDLPLLYWRLERPLQDRTDRLAIMTRLAGDLADGHTLTLQVFDHEATLHI